MILLQVSPQIPTVFVLKSNDSQIYSLTSHQYQETGELDFRVTSLSTPFNAETRAEMQIAPQEYLHTSMGEDDSTFLIPSSNNDARQPTILRQQEYNSRIDESFLDDSEPSISDPRITLSSPPPRSAMPRSHSPEEIHPVSSYVPNRKRKLADNGNFFHSWWL